MNMNVVGSGGHKMVGLSFDIQTEKEHEKERSGVGGTMYMGTTVLGHVLWLPHRGRCERQVPV